MVKHNNLSNSSKLKLLRIDTTQLAISDDRVGTVIDWTTPAALPFAPASVLGVVCIHGAMFTLVDPRALLEGDSYVPPTSRAFIVALRGDEHLALSVDQIEETVDVHADEIDLMSNQRTSFCVGSFSRNGSQIPVVNPDAIFSYAMRGRERRRRRS